MSAATAADAAAVSTTTSHGGTDHTASKVNAASASATFNSPSGALTVQLNQAITDDQTTFFQIDATPPGVSAFADVISQAGATPATFQAYIYDDTGVDTALLGGTDFIVTGPGGRQILVQDPAGNVVELFQPA